jgi:hypothetical protein
MRNRTNQLKPQVFKPPNRRNSAKQLGFLSRFFIADQKDKLKLQDGFPSTWRLQFSQAAKFKFGQELKQLLAL